MDAHQRPISLPCVEIGVADTRVLDVNENLIRTRLRDRYLLVLDFTTGLLNDLSPLLFGDFSCHSGDEALAVTEMWEWIACRRVIGS